MADNYDPDKDVLFTPTVCVILGIIFGLGITGLFIYVLLKCNFIQVEQQRARLRQRLAIYYRLEIPEDSPLLHPE